MNGLRNPWVSGALALVAVGFVAYQFKPMWDRRARRAPAPAATTATAPAQQTAPSTPPSAPAGKIVNASNARSSGIPAGAATIDSSYIITRIAEWLESPRRDPFLFSTAQEGIIEAIPGAPSPVQQWTLKSTWRQSGERRAVINNGVYREGDDVEIAGFVLERIDTGEVWIRGTNGLESLTFDYRKPAATSTNSVSTNSVTTKSVNKLKPMDRLERALLGPQK